MSKVAAGNHKVPAAESISKCRREPVLLHKALYASYSHSTEAVSKLYNLQWMFALQQIIANPHLEKILKLMSCTVWEKSVQFMRLSLLLTFSYPSKQCPQSGQNVIW